MTSTELRPNVKLQKLQWYTDHGFRLFWLVNDPSDPNYMKRPGVKNWQKKPGMSVKTAIRQGFHRGRNVGAAIPPGVVIIDVDDRKGGCEDFENLVTEHLSPRTIEDLISSTFAVKSGGGRGFHLYYELPRAAKTAQHLAGKPGIDLLTDGRQVLTPGCVHPLTGAHYRAIGTEYIAPLPNELIDFVQPRVEDPTGSIMSRALRSDTGHLWGVVTPDELRCLLGALDPIDFADYPAWISIMSAAHHATGGDPDAKGIFAEWSAGDPCYATAAVSAVDAKWKTFRAGREGAEPTVATLRSIFNHVQTKSREADPGQISDDLQTAIKITQQIKQRIVASEVEEIAHDPVVLKLSDYIQSLEPGWENADPAVKPKIIFSISQLDECHWSDLCGQLHEVSTHKTTPNKLLKLVRKHADKLKTSDKPSFAKYVEIIAAKSVDAVTGSDKGNLVSPPNDQFYVYKDGVWIGYIDKQLEAKCQAVAVEMVDLEKSGGKAIPDYSRKAMQRISGLAHVDSTLLYHREDLPSCVNLRNGTLWVDPMTGYCSLRPHDRNDYLTTQLPYEYDPHAMCPDFDTMLEQVFDHVKRDYTQAGFDDLIRHFWELVGYMIQPHKDLPRILIWVGNGHNGKSKIVEIITKLVGEGNWISAQVGEFFSDNRPHNIPAAERKLIFVDDDVDNGVVLADGALKKCSETKSLYANPKNKQGYQARLFLTPILITNNKMRLRDISTGITRRLDVLEWNTNISHLQKSPLPDRVLAEQMPGVLNKAIEGLSRLRKRREFQTPACVLDYRDRFLASANSVYSFWSKISKLEIKGEKTATQDLYVAYVMYMRNRGDHRFIPNMDTFVSSLSKSGVEINSNYLLNWVVDTAIG